MNLPSLPSVVHTPEVHRALQRKLPMVALESAVITHGLPRPHNHSLARGMEQAIRDEGSIPVTIAVLDGKIRLGLTEEDLQRLANEPEIYKIGPRDLSSVLWRGASGGTTVASTLWIAHRAHLRVLATGGIGGVHSVEKMDISADLPALTETPLIVVCSGAKAILDLAATFECLETWGIPVVGYQTNEFPAFYSHQSGLPVNIRLNTPQEVVEFAQMHWELGQKSAVLVCQPPPRAQTIPRLDIEKLAHQARLEAEKKKIHHQRLTPFLLQRLSDLTHGETLRTNLALLLNNAVLAAQIAKALKQWERQAPTI